jgi:hypothetical protein
MRWMVLATVMAASGCSNDPCAQFSGQTCISLEVVGAKSFLIDQLRIDASGVFTLTDQPSPEAPRSQPAPPPIELAVLPGAIEGEFVLTVRAFRDDSEIAVASTNGALAVGKVTSVTVEFGTLTLPDMGRAGDLAQPPRDLAGGPPDGMQCDPLTQTPCPSGQKCTIVTSSMCGTAGPITPGSTCTTDPSDDCTRGSQCVFPGDLNPDNGVCEQFCSRDQDCTEQGVILPSNVPHCLNSLAGTTAKLCTVPCNPVATLGATNCPRGAACVYGNTGTIPEYTFCDRAGTGSDGQPCDGNFRCASGFNCVAINTSTRCRAMCRANTDTDCTGGFVCKPGASSVSPLFGYCCPSSGC